MNTDADSSELTPDELDAVSGGRKKDYDDPESAFTRGPIPFDSTAPSTGAMPVDNFPIRGGKREPRDFL